jgi:hypothetical protein
MRLEFNIIFSPVSRRNEARLPEERIRRQCARDPVDCGCYNPHWRPTRHIQYKGPWLSRIRILLKPPQQQCRCCFSQIGVF